MSLPSEIKQEAPRGVFVQKQGMDIYMVMLILSFTALVMGCIFLALQMRTYEWKVKVPAEAKVPAYVPPELPAGAEEPPK